MWLQSAGIDLAAIIAAACCYLGIEKKELARRFNVDRSAISRATLRVSRDPELPAATKTIQREPELERNQHLSYVPFFPNILLPIEPVAGSGFVTAGKIDRGTGGCPYLFYIRLSALYWSLPLSVLSSWP